MAACSRHKTIDSLKSPQLLNQAEDLRGTSRSNKQSHPSRALLPGNGNLSVPASELSNQAAVVFSILSLPNHLSCHTFSSRLQHCFETTALFTKNPVYHRQYACRCMSMYTLPYRKSPSRQPPCRLIAIIGVSSTACLLDHYERNFLYYPFLAKDRIL